LNDPDNSDTELEYVRAAREFRSYIEESPTIPSQLHSLLFQLGITRAPKYRVKGIPRPGCMEFTCTVEVFNGQEVVGKHASPTPHAMCAEVVADAAWQALMSWNRS
jgi:hypothetical protein